MESIVDKEQGLERAARFRLSAIKEIAAGFSGWAFDAGKRESSIQIVLISSIRGVILPQGNLDGTS